MGMFDDYIDPDAIDPWCGVAIEGFQGKDGPCLLSTYRKGGWIDFIEDGVLELHTIHDSMAGDHWVDGIAVIYHHIWIATIITQVSNLGTRYKNPPLWQLHLPKE